MSCVYQGTDSIGRITLRCPRLGGKVLMGDLHECYHPDRPRTSGRPGICVIDWPGPWVLPHQEFEAATVALCATCVLPRPQQSPGGA